MKKHFRSAPLVLLIILFFPPAKSFAQDSEPDVLWTANWSSDGQYIAVGGDDGIIRIFDGKTFELIRPYSLNDQVKRVRWHPRKNILAVAATGNGTQLIDIEKDKVTPFNGVDNFGGRSIAWNHNGRLIAIADYEGRLSLWNNKGKLLKLIKKESTTSYVAVDWHPKKNEVIALSKYIRQYDRQGRLIRKVKHREKDVLMLCIKWHPSGDFFVIGDYGDYEFHYPALIQFWKPDMTLEKSIELSKAEYRNISWNKAGSLLATASDAMRIWSKEGDLLAEGPSEDLLWGIDWSPDGQYIVTSSEKRKIIIWNKKGEIVHHLRVDN